MAVSTIANKEVNKMKKMFMDSELELVLFGFDVITTSGLNDESESETGVNKFTSNLGGSNTEDSWWK